MMKKAIFLLVLFFSLSLHARVEVLDFSSIENEATYNKLIDELRCLVCQNQNLADSNAELAVDMRRKTYEMIEEGKKEQEIVDFMVARYGDFVRYRPPVNKATLLLWIGPFILMLFAVYILMRVIKRNNEAKTEKVVSESELSRAESLLKDEAQDSLDKTK